MKRRLRTVILAIGIAGVHAAAAADRTLVHEAVIDAPVADVWRMFTTSEGARKWMAPKIEIDFRVGGLIRSSYHPESTLDDEHTILNRILAYEPRRMISIRNEQAPAGFLHAELFQQTWSVMTFEPVDESRTHVRLIGLNYGHGPEWDVIHQHFEQGNAYLLNLLQQQLAGREQEQSGDAPNESDEAAIHAEVLVDATADEIWHAWTTSEGAEEFLAPEAKIDLTIDGPFEIYFFCDPVDGQRGSEGCTVLTYKPKEMLSFSWNAPPQFKNARHLHTWVVLRFEEADAGVHVRLKHLGFEALKGQHAEHAEEIDEVREYFSRVWPFVLNSLKRRFDDGPRWDAAGRERW